MRIGVLGKGKRAAAWRLGWDALKAHPYNFVALACVGGSAQTLHMRTREIRFENGLTVLLLEKHGVPMINVFALLKTGGGRSAGRAGWRRYRGILRKGTKGRTAQHLR